MSDTEVAVETPDFAPYFKARRLAMSEDPALMELAYRLRYEVYCKDCHFLNEADYPEHKEQDSDDSASLHAFAFNLQDELVGYSRLVMPDAAGLFPWRAHCAELLPGVVLPPCTASAEVSRLMVRRDYRRRRGDVIQGVTVGLPPPAEEDFMERVRRRPQILLSLYRQMYQHSLQSGIQYWYAAMERGLAGALEQMGFPFRRIGPVSDYFGPVAPYLADLRELEHVLQTSLPELLGWLQQNPDTSP